MEATKEIKKQSKANTEENKQPKAAPVESSMTLRSQNYQPPMQFERTVDVLAYHTVAQNEQLKNAVVRTNAKMVNPITGENNIHIEVKEKKKPDGFNVSASRPDCEIQDKEQGIHIIIDAKFYEKNTPPTQEMKKDIECRKNHQEGANPPVGIMVVPETNDLNPKFIKEHTYPNCKDNICVLQLKKDDNAEETKSEAEFKDKIIGNAKGCDRGYVNKENLDRVNQGIQNMIQFAKKLKNESSDTISQSTIDSSFDSDNIDKISKKKI